MKVFRTLFLVLLTAAGGTAFESAQALRRPPLVSLRAAKRKLFLDFSNPKTMGTFGAAAAGVVGLSLLSADSKMELIEVKSKLQFEFNLLDDENRRHFTDRTNTIGDIRSLSLTAANELDGIETDCSAKIEDIKSIINNAGRQQSRRITQVMGSSRP